MERSNTSEINMSSESTDDEFVITYNNSNNVVLSNGEGKQIDDHCKHSVFEEKNNRSLESMETRSSESDEELGSSNKILSVVKMDSKAADKASNISKTNLSRYHTSDKSEDTNSQHESPAEESLQTNKTEHRRKSIIFSSKKKSNLRETEDEEFNDSGVSFNNSNEFNSAMKTDLVVADKKATTSKTNSPNNHSISDEDEISLDNRSKNKSVAADSKRTEKIEQRRKLFALKRKVSPQRTEDEELDQSGENPKKRGRGKYQLRDLPTRSLPSTVNKKEPDEKYGPDKSKKVNNSQINDEDETEDMEAIMKMKLKWETESDEIESKDDSPLSKNQVAHNHKILKILNQGSLAYLRSLSRVGPKTANMIYEYRKLNGKLESIRDLENMPGWSAKFFEQFVAANNIMLD